MNRLASIVLGSLLVVTPAAGAFAASADAIRIADADPGQKLTLGSAKQLVAQRLVDNGQRQLRVGRAEFDRDGNVAVEVVSIQGIPVSHVVVDAKTGLVAAAQLAKKTRHTGG
jgi:hypothetical protein